MKKPFMIAVGGGSGSGKSTFVSLLQGKVYSQAKREKLPVPGILLLSQDHYYKDLTHLSESERAQINFDQPAALDTALLFEHIEMLAHGEAVLSPSYDFATHCRSPIRASLESQPVVILDGIFSLYFEQLRSLFHLKVYIDCPDDLRFIRRLTRDMSERGRSLESVTSQYLTSVRPMHQKYIQATKAFADLIVPWEENNDPAVAAVLALINEKLAPNRQ